MNLVIGIINMKINKCPCGRTPKRFGKPWGEYQIKCECGRYTQRFGSLISAEKQWNKKGGR